MESRAQRPQKKPENGTLVDLVKADKHFFPSIFLRSNYILKPANKRSVEITSIRFFSQNLRIYPSKILISLSQSRAVSDWQ